MESERTLPKPGAAWSRRTERRRVGMKIGKYLFLLLLSGVLATEVRADQIPYPHAGTVAPQTLVYATGNGIDAYYMGSTAGYDDQIEVYDLTTKWSSGKILDNKSTTVGTEIIIGAGAGQINVGDQLLFYIDSPYQQFASLSSYSSDGINHAYITTYSGGTANGKAIPAGLFVGMEDLPNGKSDLNYNDDDFVFTGVNPVAATPEPASLALLGTGALGLFWLRRRGVIPTKL